MEAWVHIHTHAWRHEYIHAHTRAWRHAHTRAQIHTNSTEGLPWPLQPLWWHQHSWKLWGCPSSSQLHTSCVWLHVKKSKTFWQCQCSWSKAVYLPLTEAVCRQASSDHMDQRKGYTPSPLSHMFRVGQDRIYTPYMTVYLVISLPKIPYIHRIYMVLANPTHVLASKNDGILVDKAQGKEISWKGSNVNAMWVRTFE